MTVHSGVSSSWKTCITSSNCHFHSFVLSPSLFALSSHIIPPPLLLVHSNISLSLSLSLTLSLRFFDSSVLSHLSFIPSPLGLISCFVLWIGRFRFHFPPLHSFSCSTSPLISMKIRMEGVRKEEVGGWRPGGEMMKMTCLCNLGLCWYAVITRRRRRNGNLIGQWQSCWQSTIFFKEKHQCCCHCCKTVVSQVTRVLLMLPQNQQLEEQPEGYCC